MVVNVRKSLPRVFPLVGPHRGYQSHQSSLRPPTPSAKPSFRLSQWSEEISQARVTVIGGGSWGSAVARKVAFNLSQLDNPSLDPSLRLWLHEEWIDGQPLSQLINQRRENPKYLPGVYLPQNVLAVSNLKEAIRGANVLLFVLPHHFLPSLLHQLRELQREDAAMVPPSTVCASFIKGVQVDGRGKLTRYSQIIQENLAVNHVAAVSQPSHPIPSSPPLLLPSLLSLLLLVR